MRPQSSKSLAFFQRYAPIIDDWAAFAHYATNPLPATAWTNTLRTTPRALDERVKANPIPWYPGAFRFEEGVKPSVLLPYLAGCYSIQEEAAMLPVALLNPQPGERVLDLCAAPGNKTVQMAVRMQSSGLVVANDRSRARLGILRRSISRLGLTNIALTVYDATSYTGQPESFDRVLADVPCSGEGTIRRYNKNTPFISDGRRTKLRNIQSSILKRAITLCRPGGLIAYATCTFAPEENEAVVSEALQNHEGLVSMEEVAIEGLKTAPGITSWEGQAFDPSLHLAHRIWPHQNDTGGFFVALLRKHGSDQSPLDIRQLPGESTVGPAEVFQNRFGIPADTFEGHALQRFGKFMLIRSFHEVPGGIPEIIQAGMPFCRPADKSQKMKTGAAMKWGRLATRNVVELNRAQVLKYGRQESFELDCSGLDLTPGYVMVRYEDLDLGLGLLRMEGATGILESQLPRHWVHTLEEL